MDFDFNDLLREAGSNNRHASERISQIDVTSRRDQHKSMRSLATQRKVLKEEMRRKAPPPPQPPRFTIPKKKKEEEAVNEASVQAFLRRKEMAKIQKLRQEQEDREELIKHRMKESGGRASKKIAKHFGLDALNMQKKYGNDRDHEVALERNAVREMEEHDRLSSELRSGVYKAIAKNKEVLNSKEKTERQEPFRVGTRKATSICGLNSRSSKGEYKEPEPYVPTIKVGEKRKSASGGSGVPMKKRPAPPALDFGSLMKQAQENDGKDVPVVRKPQSAVKDRQETKEVRPKAVSRSAEYATAKPRPAPPIGANRSLTNSKTTSSKNSSQHSQRERRPETSSTSVRRDREASSRCAACANEQFQKRGRKTKAVATQGQKKTPPPEPDREQIGVLVPGKRYLPSDARYKAALAAGLVQPAPAQSAFRSDRQVPAARLPPRSDRPIGSSSNRQITSGSSKLGASSAQISRKSMSSREMPSGHSRPRSPAARERGFSNAPRSQQVDRKRDYDTPRGYASGPPPRRPPHGYEQPPTSRFVSNSDEEYGNDYDEDYDSEMDDFIDDTEVEDFQHRELEDTLKLINRNYDKKRWKYNEMTIDERAMQSSYRDINREEMRSAKIAMYEDIREAQRGSTAV